jgi:hypothetical protein
MKKEKKKSVRINWENILSPREMKERFGHQYLIEKRGEEIYINSDYLVERVLDNSDYFGSPENFLKNSERIIETIPIVYRHIIKEVKSLKKKYRSITRGNLEKIKKYVI